MNATALAEWLLYLLILVPVSVVVFDSLCRVAFLVIASARAVPDEPVDQDVSGLTLLILVVAHNEEKTMGGTLEALTQQTTQGEVVVLADHCSDQTAAIAIHAGARVLVRSEGHAGKADALSWFARGARELLSRADIVAVLDADSLVDAGFCDAIRAAFGRGVEAVQAFVNPVSGNGFPLTTLVSLSEILSEKIDDAARSRLGWSVPLRGTGMAFRTETFIKACEGLGTQVDDIELSVRLAKLGIAVRSAPHAVVNDPKSDRALGLARQRGRWLRGQRQVWRTKGRAIRKLLRAGLPNWSLIQAMLLKPKTALVAMRVILLVLLWVWPFEHSILHGVLLWAVMGSLVSDAVYYVSGVRFTGHAGKYLASLAASPVLLLLWAISWGYSFLPAQEWLRVDGE